MKELLENELFLSDLLSYETPYMNAGKDSDLRSKRKDRHHLQWDIEIHKRMKVNFTLYVEQARLQLSYFYLGIPLGAIQREIERYCSFVNQIVCDYLINRKEYRLLAVTGEQFLNIISPFH